jgi:Cu2+-containing amine oxidase
MTGCWSVSCDFDIVRAMPAKRVAKAKPAVARKSSSSKDKAKPARTGTGKAARAKGRADLAAADPALFAPLTPGEVADALRTLTEDRRVATMAKVGRYRVVASEPLVVKPPHWMAGHRLARMVIYDYSNDRAVDACVDLDAGVVAHLEINKAQPMLSRDEEATAISVAVTDDRVREKLSLGDEPQCAMHYWGKDASDLSYTRRSAAVIFGRSGGHPSLVAVVDLIDNLVTSVVPASQW